MTSPTLPFGVSSAFRRLPDLDGEPFIVHRAQGPWLTDQAGRRHVDFAMAMGATILGHAHPAVVEAGTRALAQGAMPGFPNPLEPEAAAALARVGSPLERVLFITTGSEAVHLACRIARARHGRPLVAKIAGGYDGWYDGQTLGTTGTHEADLHGPRPVRDGITLVRWNSLDDLAALFREQTGQIAAVLIEPVLANAGCVLPAPGYLEGVRELAHRHGALVIADEVLMGLRLGPCLTSLRLGLTPDLATMGKAIGSGLPVAAVLGTTEAFAPVLDGRVSPAGTYHGNPLVASAVLATLGTLGEADYPALQERGEVLRGRIVAAFAQAGLTVSTSGFGSVFNLWFASQPPASYAEAKALFRPELTLALHMALRRRGVIMLPAPSGRLFVSFAHDDEALELAAAAFDEAAGEVAKLL